MKNLKTVFDTKLKPLIPKKIIGAPVYTYTLNTVYFSVMPCIEREVLVNISQEIINE